MQSFVVKFKIHYYSLFSHTPIDIISVCSLANTNLLNTHLNTYSHKIKLRSLRNQKYSSRQVFLIQNSIFHSFCTILLEFERLLMLV
jgi:hypothetical protein